MDFFDYLKKTFSADSGRTGRARANLRPFLDFEWRVLPIHTENLGEYMEIFNEREDKIQQREIKVLSPANCQQRESKTY